MDLTVRRIVTDHDASGKAVIAIDELAQDVLSRRPGIQSTTVWSSREFPANNTEFADGANNNVGTSLAEGTVFRIIRFEPGNTRRMHRTNSLDYVVCLSGEIDMEMDEGVEVRIRAGDVLIQRGTMHDWVNKGTEPCVLAIILTGAAPVIRDGTTLPEEG